jgi:hypothetical protein
MQLGIKFLRGLKYHGVAHLDFRRDQRDGLPKLLDFNVRLAGTNEISTRSGVDFALMLYKLALGEHAMPCFAYETGLEFRWVLFGDIQYLLCTPHKYKTLLELARSDPLHQGDVRLYDLRSIMGTEQSASFSRDLYARGDAFRHVHVHHNTALVLLSQPCQGYLILCV